MTTYYFILKRCNKGEVAANINDREKEEQAVKEEVAFHCCIGSFSLSREKLPVGKGSFLLRSTIRFARPWYCLHSCISLCLVPIIIRFINAPFLMI